MPGATDKVIKKVMDKGNDESSAIRILKSNKTIHQNGRHLAMGPPAGPTSDKPTPKPTSWKKFARKKKGSK